MSDNTTLNKAQIEGGDVIATDDIGGAKYQRVKLIHGADGVNAGDISTANPFPITLPDALGPFGDLLVAPLVPILQLDFVYGINTQTGVSTTANSATVDTNVYRLRLQSGTNSAGSAVFNSRLPAKYRPGQGVVARFTAAFTTGVASSTQIVGMGDANNGYFFGFNAAAFGILHRNATVDTWVAQTAWNGDKCDGTGTSGFNWNKTFGCVCQIKYPYLGYGNITFWAQDPLTSRFILCHTIRYNNTTATVQATNPTMPFYAQSLNAGATSNQIIYVGSVGAFLAGERSFVGSPKWALDNNKAAVTTETCLINIRNATTYNGATNRGLLRFNSISMASTANNGIAVLRFKLGATIGGSPSWTCVNGATADSGVTITSGNSIASYDTAGTTVAVGTYLFNLSVGSPGNAVVDLMPFNIFLGPGEIMTISGFSNASTSIGASVNWSEDI